MAQLAVALAASAIGFAIGGPTGAQIGFTIGASLGSSLGPSQKVRGPRLTDTTFTGLEYGVSIPWIAGTMRVAGTPVYLSEKREVSTTTESGGKGGQSVESTTYSYNCDALYLLADVQADALIDVFRQGELIWTSRSTAIDTTLEASGNTDAWEEILFYSGAFDQDPDPTYEAAVGVGNAPAYVGRATVFIRGLQLDQGGNLPALSFVLSTDADTGYVEAPAVTDIYSTDISLYGSLQVGTTSYETGWRLFAEKTTTSPAAQQLYSYGVDSPVPEQAELSLPGVGPGGVTPIGGTSDCDSLIFNSPGGNAALGYYGAGYATYTWSSGDAETYLVEGTTIWISFDDNKLRRFAKAGGAATVTNASATVCRTLVKIGSSLFGATNSGDLLEWNSSTLALIDTYTQAVNSTQLLCTDGTDLFDIADGGLARWVRASETWETVVPDLGGIATFAGTSGNQQAPVLLGGYIYLARVVADDLIVRRAPYDLGVATPNTVPLQDVVTELCLRAGLSEDQIDTTDLSGNVSGIISGQITPVRSILEQLAACYLFEGTEAGVLKFVTRGGASIATIPYTDLAAGLDSAAEEPMAIDRQNDIEAASQVVTTYLNLSDSYQAGAEYSDRLTTESNAVQQVQLAIALTPAEAKGRSDTYVQDAAVARTTFAFSLGRAYSRIEPTDVLVVPDGESNTYRVRLTKVSEANGVLECAAVLDDPQVLSTSGITSDYYDAPTTVLAPGETTLYLIDGPLLRDADNVPGLYAAASGSGRWPGASVLDSLDATQYVERARVTENAVAGSCLTALPSWSGGIKWDEVSTVRVSVNGALSSYTRAQILNDSSVGAYLIGVAGRWELINARTAAMVSAGVYDLSGLLRGRRGTEQQIGLHEIGDRIVLLRSAGVRSIAQETADIGVLRYFRGVTLGRLLATATDQTITPASVRLRPWAPCDLRAVDNGDGTFDVTWQRRSRLSCGFTGANGVVVPLGEDLEQYDVLLYDSSDVLQSTQTVSAAAATVTAVVTDYVRIYQRSATVGRGYYSDITL